MVGAYAYHMAPDVALTEAMIGALLTTYVYVLILRGMKVLRVGFVNTRLLFEKRPADYDGIEYVLLKNFCDSYGYKMDIKEFDDKDKLLKALKKEEIDVACGDVIDSGIKILETKIFKFSDGTEKGLLNVSIDEKSNIISEREGFYTIKFINHENEFESYLQEIKENGKYDEVIRKYAR